MSDGEMITFRDKGVIIGGEEFSRRDAAAKLADMMIASGRFPASLRSRVVSESKAHIDRLYKQARKQARERLAEKVAGEVLRKVE